MPSRVVGLGHVGLYVRDLPRMTAFYRDFMGMTITKTNDNSAFFSSDPSRTDHEVVIIRGQRPEEDPRLINQISLRVASLGVLRARNIPWLVAYPCKRGNARQPR